MASRHEGVVSVPFILLLQALAERFASGASALKADKWRQHEMVYAQRLKQLAEREKVSGWDVLPAL